MSPPARLRIAIVGCGIGGPASALLLARQGHSVVVFERAGELGPKGAGILLAPTGQLVLDRLGLLADAAAAGSRIHRLVGHTASGRQIIDVRYRHYSPGLFGLGIHRGTLFSILRKAMESRQIEIRTGFEVLSINEERTVVGDGISEGPFDLIVVADGARSALRASVCETQRVSPYAYGALWASVVNWGEYPDNVLRQVYRGTREMMGLLPSGLLEGEEGRQISLFWSLPMQEVETWRAEGIDAWKRRIVDLDPSSRELLDQIVSADQITVASYVDARTHASARTQIVAIGDAAHASSPQLGQGASMALFDAMILADCLEDEPNIVVALMRFHGLRRKHVRFYQQASKWMTPFFQSGRSLLAWPRDLRLGPICRIPWLRREMAATMCGVKSGIFSRLANEEQIKQLGIRFALGGLTSGSKDLVSHSSGE
ncbi:MAG TPA: NAD(P)/FAD-dependent oxidoreductase [Fimbriimonadaceae bacterium]|nr:NAD(P)/FAD-dependent oxidoreductase [Fimbriimonadaceae bacterium]